MVNNTILIGKYVYKFLIEDKELQSLIKGNVFPLIADKDVTFPFIVYGKENILPKYVKDFSYEDTVNLRFDIVSDDYSQSLDVANRVRNLLDGKQFKDDLIYITQMRIDNITESYFEDAYIQEIHVSALCRNV